MGLGPCELMEKGLECQGPGEVAVALPASCFRMLLGRGAGWIVCPPARSSGCDLSALPMILLLEQNSSCPESFVPDSDSFSRSLLWKG